MNDQPRNVTKTGFVTGVAAMFANVVEQVLHPFELLKFRFQSKRYFFLQEAKGH